MNALLVQTIDNSKPSDEGSDMPSLSLSTDVKGHFSTTPTAHVRDLVAAGIKPAGCMVYFAIADRCIPPRREYFRSNEKLAEECGGSIGWVKKQIKILKDLGYLSVWYVDGGRRMRIHKAPTRGTLSVPPGVHSVDHQGYTQCTTDKRNNINKTTIQQCVDSLGRQEGVLWGGSLARLVTTHGLDAVRRGLAVYDSYDPKEIDNPIGFLTNAIKQKWLPRKQKPKKFTECPLEHEKIIQAYTAGNEDHTKIVADLRAKGQGDGLVACKIFKGKI